MKQKKILTAIAITSTMFASSASMATLNIYSNEALIQEKAQEKAQYSFTQEGLSPERTNVVQATVRDMPLEMALETITNDGWKIQINKEAEDMPVSFEGGQSWPYIMERLSMDYKLKTHIDWKYRILTVYSSQQRDKAIADRRQELIEKEAQAQKELKEQMKKAKKQYQEQQKRDQKEDADKHQSSESQNIGKDHSQKSSKMAQKEANNETKRSYDEQYKKTKKERQNEEIIKEHHEKTMSGIDDPSVNEYKNHQTSQQGYPYEQLVEGAPFKHVVQKGDTLWDISDVYMNNPWFWPEIWYINPDVENPHLIYPGEKVTIDPRQSPDQK